MRVDSGIFAGLEVGLSRNFEHEPRNSFDVRSQVYVELEDGTRLSESCPTDSSDLIRRISWASGHRVQPNRAARCYDDGMLLPGMSGGQEQGESLHDSHNVGETNLTIGVVLQSWFWWLRPLCHFTLRCLSRN